MSAIVAKVPVAFGKVSVMSVVLLVAVKVTSPLAPVPLKSKFFSCFVRTY